MTGNEGSSSINSISSSQLSNSQDIPKVVISPEVIEPKITDNSGKKSSIVRNNFNTISAQEYSDHMSLASAQLETVALMLQALDQADGGTVGTE
jgi:hypothetical protein